ncbi:phenylacetate--CoA ligase family protein [Streptomyces sp. NPDC097617]|uniref:phenylacetate--CoA ligase family protein n=1 Tax=Streptomyces sp. NPDC097617 TaxID=3366091 RepID=UPI0037FDB566
MNETLDFDRWERFALEAARTVPAYQRFLAERGIDASAMTGLPLDEVPAMDKSSYVNAFPLEERCRGADSRTIQMVSMSSGSSGTPTTWPRRVDDEVRAATPFRRVLEDTFGADRKHTLAVVCFPLGSWVGGLYTLECLQHLARTGLLLTIAAPGNNVDAVLQAVQALAPHVEQTVLLGYPPFLKDVVDAGRVRGVQWERYAMHLVFAGEVFSENWRDVVCERAAITSPETATASLYGTADAGVLAYETPVSIRLRRSIASTGGSSQALFGSDRLPSLMRYDPAIRHFDAVNGELFLTTDGVVPLVRYTLGDTGGRSSASALSEMCTEVGILAPDSPPHEPAPYVWLFGRTLFALSMYGANIYPESIAAGLERDDSYPRLTGKFVMEIQNGERPQLRVVAEIAPNHHAEQIRTESTPHSILNALREQNSEYMNYVPTELQLPLVETRSHGDPEYFPVGMKHRYTRFR